MGVGTSGTNSKIGKTDITNKDDMNVSIVPVDKKVENKERRKTPTGSDKLPNQPFKKQNSNVKNPPMVDNKSKHKEKLPTDVNNLKDLGTSGTTEEKLNQKNGKISSKVTDDSEGKIIQNSKDGGSAKLPDNKKLGNNGSGSAKLLGNKKLGNSGSGKDFVANPSLAKGKSKSKLALDSTANNMGSKQEQSSEGKIIKKSNNDGFEKLPDNKKLGNSGSGKDLVANSTLAKGKAKSRHALDSTTNNKEFNEGQSSEGKIKKSSKDDGSTKWPDNNQPGNSGSGKDLVASSSLPKEKSKSRLTLDSTKESKEQTHENKRKLTMNKSFKAPALSTDRDKKSAYQEFVCGQKPNDVNDDKSNWFMPLPWDERLKNAYDQGMAILLHNMDPDYTSSEI
nr:protein anti-silencing 1 [Tanacetum cinerariifolium]